MQILASPHAGGVNISGGQETVTVGGFKYVVFTSSGTLTVIGEGVVQLLAVGGGGAGGGNQAGAGGGGEIDNGYWTTGTLLNSNQTITIGAAGVGGSGIPGTQGGSTTIGSLVTALGGGGGNAGTPPGSGNGGPGGSGGGGGVGGTGGTASGLNTFAGGSNPIVVSPPRGVGGGGGA
ncbi:hypothetical protein UFOVP1503_1, partial [uncultured Caudovirales phage]